MSTSFYISEFGLVLGQWKANPKVLIWIFMDAKSEKIFEDLQFVHLNEEIAKIFAKPLKGLMKTV